MFGKKSSLYKIGSLVLFLGIFGLLGTSVLAYECNDKTSTITDGSASTHPFTCELNTTAKKTLLANYCQKDGSVSQTFGYACPTGYMCHRCVPQEGKITCPEGQSEQNNKCVCSDTQKDPVDGKCKDEEEGSGPGLVNKCGTGATAEINGICTCNGVTIDAGVECQKEVNETPVGPCEKDKPVTEKCTCEGDFKNVDGICKSCSDPGVCCGIELNTDVPFIGRCIAFGSDASSSDTTVVTETTAFPILMGSLTKIMISFLLLICFGGILVGGVMVAASGGDTKRASDGKSLIGKVIIAMAVLGASGIILHLINPNFF